MITTPTEELITNEGWSRVDIYDAASGRITTLEDRLWREEAPSPYGWIVSPVWSTDGNALAFRVDFDGYPGQVFVVRFDDVSFAYDGLPEGLPVLDGVTFEVRPGEVVGIVGPPGSGKSTIAHLLPRYYDVTSGCITIDGQDVRDVTLVLRLAPAEGRGIHLLAGTWSYESDDLGMHGRPTGSLVEDGARVSGPMTWRSHSLEGRR